MTFDLRIYIANPYIKRHLSYLYGYCTLLDIVSTLLYYIPRAGHLATVALYEGEFLATTK